LSWNQLTAPSRIVGDDDEGIALCNGELLLGSQQLSQTPVAPAEAFRGHDAAKAPFIRGLAPSPSVRPIPGEVLAGPFAEPGVEGPHTRQLRVWLWSAHGLDHEQHNGDKSQGANASEHLR